MALRPKLVHSVILALAWGALGVPAPAGAAPVADPADGRVSLRDGIPAAERPAATIGTRTGPATALVGEKPQRPKLDPEATEAAREDGKVSVIIRLRDQVNLSTVANQARGADHRARGATVVTALKDKAARTQGGVRQLLNSAGATKVRPFWVFNGLSATVSAAALEQLAASPDVESVALDEQYTLPETTAGEPRLPTWGLEKVRATDVWADYGFTGKGVVVGIMDGGVDGEHPALAGSYRGRDGDHAHSWFNATTENYPTPGDRGGHGTHVAGTIVGAPPGKVTGVAPGAEWIAAKIFNDAGRATSSGIHASFEWMLAPGGDPAMAPDVVNNSWGADDTYQTDFWEDVNAWVAAGIFPNFAAGNNGPGPLTVGSPASFPQSFAVGATDSNDRIASFSSRGSPTWDGVQHPKPQVSAPGQDIYSAWPRALDPDGYHTISGTSMATPHVTGVIALLLQAKPGLSIEAIRELLTSTARTEPHMGRLPNSDYGAGIVNARAAIESARYSGTVSGTVRGPDGPLAATVSIPELGISTTANRVTGYYDLRVKAGTWTVHVSNYGSVPQESRVTVAVDGTHNLDVTLAAAAVHTVSGTVRAGGAPLADAEVRIGGTPLAPVYTGPDGRYTVSVAAGTYPISAQLTGYARRSVQQAVTRDTTLDFSLTTLGVDAAPGWREYQNNPRRTGHSADPLLPEALTARWQVDVPGGQALFSSPVIADDRVYLMTEDGQLHARALGNGAELWRFSGGDAMRGTPAVAGGKVYLGGGDDQVFYALDAATGAPVWTYPTDDHLNYTTPTVVGDTVYFGTGFGEGDGGWVYALDAATGALRWRSFIGSQIFFAPAVAAGTVFAASYDARRLVALDAATGAQKWALTRTDDSFAAMPTHADGTLYVGTANFDTGAGSLLAVDAASGTLRWEAAGHGDASGSAPNVHGDLVIAGSHQNGWVAAYDRSTGARRWVTPAGSAVSNAMVAADGVVIGGSQLDRRAWALDAYTGALRWDVTLADNVLAAPAFADGRLVVAARNGQLTMFESPATITGKITGAGGAPLAATVRIAQTGETAGTDPATGTYTLRHRAGSWRLEVSAYGHLSASRDVSARPGRTLTVDANLQPAGAGSLAGTVTDESGRPLAGVTVALPGTPLPGAVTDDAGRYAFPEVAAGPHQLRVTLNGYVPVQQSVTVTGGERTVRDLTLQRYQIAVTGDYQGTLTKLLTSKGYRVEATTIAAIADRAGDYSVVVANGAADDPGAEVFKRFLAGADAAGTSVIFLDTWGTNYGSLLHLSRYTGDPPTAGTGDLDGEVSVIARAGHPLTEGLPIGKRTPLLTADREYAWFSGYRGHSVADLYVGAAEVTGSTIGYQPRTPDSVHVLLSANAVSPWTGPGNGWQPAAYTVLDNAVAYALQASYGTATGRITDADGAAVAATVSVVETGDRVGTDGDGRYRVLLPAGTYTLRVEAAGFTTREAKVTVADRGSTTTDLTLLSSGLGTITGVVRSGGEAVAGATVSVVGLDRSVTTGTDGRFTLAEVPGGTYRLRAAATGHRTATVTSTVVDGQVTATDVELVRALRVAVIGDSRDVVDNELTTFLKANEVVATAAGWEALDQLDRYDLVIFNAPTNPGKAAFLAALDKLDAAGVSAVFIEHAVSSNGGGVGLLRTHLGNPTGRSTKSSAGDPLLTPVDPAHPLFAGVSNPAQVLVADASAAYYTGHTGFKLADFGTSESGVLGGGAAFEPRTPTSVRLLLSGLSASSFASPSDGWSVDGKRVFLNAVNWAASPGLGGYAARVTGADGEVAGISARIVETDTAAQVTGSGRFSLAHPAGTYTLEVKAFGYQVHSQRVTFAAGQVETAEIALTLSKVGTVTGLVTDRTTGAPLAGARVEVDGAPRSATTGPDGRFTLSNVAAGRYAVRATAAGHIRQVFPDVVVNPGTSTALALALLPTARAAVLGDFEGRAKAHLIEWGYQAEDLTWADVAKVGNYDLVVANLAASTGTDPGAAGWRAFTDAVVRADVPVVWLDQYGRGALKYLTKYEGDPQVRAEDRLDGSTQAKIMVDHPLTTGFPVGSTLALTTDNAEYAYFSGFSGVTVANLVTGAQGERGGAIGYRGRSAGSVDVLLSTMSISTYGYPARGDQPARNWNPQTELLFHNALRYALDAPPLAATVRGTVRTGGTGAPVAATVTVAETGAAVTARADGSYALPVQPGTWTVRVSTFGHQTVERRVTVAAGDTPTVDVTMPVAPNGTVEGTIRTGEGAAVAGATVTVVGTPLTATTGADGAYRISGVPVGEHTLLVRATGYALARPAVTVRSGESTRADVRLAVSRVLAVAGDSTGGEVSTLLTENGYGVRKWNWADIHLHIPELSQVEAVVLNGSGLAPTAAELNAFLAAAAEAEVSVVMAGHWGSGSIRVARTARNDPSEVSDGFTEDGMAITYTPSAAHPIFAGFEIGKPIPLMRNPQGDAQQWQYYTGYSGETIASIGEEDTGALGGGVGVRFTSTSSVEILLEGLASGSYGHPDDRWTPEALRIYLNAIAWALDASQGRITGTVTGEGAPLAGAEVRVVETGSTVRTGADGTFQLGLVDGTYTIQVSAVGFADQRSTVRVRSGETVTLPVTLMPVPRGSVSGTVTSTDGTALAGARVTVTGPVPGATTTDAQGRYTINRLVPGDYRLVVEADRHLQGSATVTVVADQVAAAPVTLKRIDVAVLGDVGDALTGSLVGAGIAAESDDWSGVLGRLPEYRVVVINGGDPTEQEFDRLVAAADAAEVSLLFTGAWGAGKGGIRLLERYGDGAVTVGGQGYRNGPVGLVGFDPAHPVFAGITDPAAIVAPDGYWSDVASYSGTYLAKLSVGTGDSAGKGVAVAYDFRTARSMHLLVSVGGVTELMGPGHGWTADTGRLMRNAVDWAGNAVQAVPARPALAASAPKVSTEKIALTGSAEFRSTVEIRRDGVPVATVTPDRDGRYQVEVALRPGANRFTAVATNHAGASAPSVEVKVVRYTGTFTFSGLTGNGTTVALLEIRDDPAQPAQVDEGVVIVLLDATGRVVAEQRMTWDPAERRYRAGFKKLPKGDYRVQARATADGWPIPLDGGRITRG